jgi:DNA modification methylase
MQTQLVALSDIDDARSLELSPREALDNETVERYMVTLDELPPIDVWEVDGEADLLVSDGLHRLRAAKRNKADSLSAVMHEGTMTEFLESAILANLLHGRAWTRAEKRNCIDAWLRIHPERTDRWIAEDLRVSHNTVEDRRDSLESVGQIDQLEVLVGKDGKRYTRDLDKVGLPLGEVHHLDAVEGLRQLQAGSVQLVFTDPPYNIGVEYGDVREDSMTREDYRDFCWRWLSECERALCDGGSLYVMQYPEVCAEWVPMLEKLNLTLRRWLTWTYPSNVGQSPRNWTRASRAILFATKGDDYTFNPYADPQPFRNPDDQRIQALIAEGREGVTPYDWWEFNLVKNVSAEKTGWENQLPLALVERIVKTSSNENDIVLDPFMGSGTTAEAATRNKRRWLGFDRNPESSVVTAARLEVEAA